MSVTLMCPNLRCRKILAVPNTTRGKRVRCAYCGTVMMVPWAKSYVSRKDQHESAEKPTKAQKDT